MEHKKNLEAGMSPFDGELRPSAIRGPESWQFFAFVFAALLAFGLSLIDEAAAPTL